MVFLLISSIGLVTSVPDVCAVDVGRGGIVVGTGPVCDSGVWMGREGLRLLRMTLVASRLFALLYLPLCRWVLLGEECTTTLGGEGGLPARRLVENALGNGKGDSSGQAPGRDMMLHVASQSA